MAVICLLAAAAGARSLYESEVQSHLYDIGDPPYATVAVHNVGKIAMTVSNIGTLGSGGWDGVLDPLTGLPAPSMSYPQGFGVDYLFEAALWVGAIVGRDTLVSSSSGGGWGVHEFWPLPYPEGDIKYRSNTNPNSPDYDSSISQQDFIAVYTDTIDDVNITGYDYLTGRLHRPLKIEVTQSSYAWGYDYAEDFIIVDYRIGNIELRDLHDVYIGLYVDNDIGREGNSYYGYDDICGFKDILKSQYIAGLYDTLNIAWAADNDGDPNPFTGSYTGVFSPTSVIATKVLRTPTDHNGFNFNWWISSWNEEDDWGPRKYHDDGIRIFYDGRLGTPGTDEDKYYMMAVDEFDYNQEETYIDRSTEGWMPPPANAMQVSNGGEIRYLLSFGPYDLGPGEILPLTVAFVGGQLFYDDTKMGTQPGKWRDFGDIQLNTLWATWVYDNPGVDTDGDGYKGRYSIFCMNPKIARIDTILNSPTDTTFDTVMSCTWSDTLYYQGDGIPDLNGASPPARPVVETFPYINEYNQGEIEVRWNGFRSETTPDQFSQRVDFEGYRVYMSRSGRPGDFTLITSYDMENFDRYEYNVNLRGWEIRQLPYSLRKLKDMYGEDFDPEEYYDKEHLYPVYNTSTGEFDMYFFTRHDWNQSDYYDTLGIHKVYPDQPYPSTLNLDTANMFYPDEVTEDGQFKYFEYRYILKNLIPSVPYYIAVTAFDHGLPGKNLPPLENEPSDSTEYVREFAQNSNSVVKEKNLSVIVYPNPYRIDGNYRQYYEGWEEPDQTAERTRALHFTNLPARCTIRIFSIDGDLIDTIEHDFPEDSPGSMHETWDMISRNEMAITSGIYYFSVESDQGSQLGKFVVIY